MSDILSGVVHQLVWGQHYRLAVESCKLLDRYGQHLGRRSELSVLDIGSGWGSSLMVLLQRYRNVQGIERADVLCQIGDLLWHQPRQVTAEALAGDTVARYYSSAERDQALDFLFAIKSEVERVVGFLPESLPITSGNVLEYASCPLAPRYDAVLGNVVLWELVEAVGGPYGYRQYLPGLWFSDVLEKIGNIVKPGGLAVFSLFDNHFFLDDAQEDCRRWNEGLFQHPFYRACMEEMFSLLGEKRDVEMLTARGHQEGVSEWLAQNERASWRYLGLHSFRYAFTTSLATIARTTLFYCGTHHTHVPEAELAAVVDQAIKKTHAKGVSTEPAASIWAYVLVYQRQ